MLVNSLVIFRFHYSNGLLYNIPKYQRDKLQRIQNIAARMTTAARSQFWPYDTYFKEPALATCGSKG